MNTMFKVILIGDSGVGKTSLISQFANKDFTETYKTTIGSDFIVKEVVTEDEIVTLQLWDTAGQERYLSLNDSFFRGVDLCILVFDLTRSTSLKGLEHWRSEFLKHMDIDEYAFVYVGNKLDSTNKRQITKHEAEKWCEEHGGAFYIETSAKTAENVENLFHEVANEIIKRNKDVKFENFDFDSPSRKGINLTYEEKKGSKNRVTCCNN